VPSAASFYVTNLPDLHQDKDHPLHIFSGHIESDPNDSSIPTNLSAHLFFVLVKARRTADRERVMFWFNVAIVLVLYVFNLTELL
jgi:carboxypeptidase D